MKRFKETVNRKRAFTLIELLVVIAIIALLMAVILPSMSLVKRQAGAAVCVSNERQILTAWVMYAQENDSKLVSPHTQVYTVGTKRLDPWVRQPSNPSTAQEEQEAITQGALYPYYEDYKLLHCPSDRRYLKPPTHGSPPYGTGPDYGGDGGYRTYSIVINLGGYGQSDEYAWAMGQGFVGSVNEICTTMLQIKSPGARFAVVEENDNRGFNDGAWMMDLGTPGLVDAFAVFHNMRSTLGFADSHAEKIVWKDDRTENYSNEINEGRTSFRSTAAENDNNEDIRWLLAHYPRR